MTDPITCSRCRHRGSDCAAPDLMWWVCDHPDLKARYEDGRALDPGLVRPDWCPGWEER